MKKKDTDKPKKEVRVVLYERRKSKPEKVVIHTKWIRVGEFESKERAKWFIETKRNGRKQSNWDYKYEKIGGKKK